MLLRYLPLILFLQQIVNYYCDTQVFHFSTMGDYHTEWKEFGPCPKEKRGLNEYQSNFRLSKRNRVTEITGNLTLLVPFDDSYTINVNFAKLGSNSGWIPNAYQIPISRACTEMIHFLQDGWKDFLRNMNAPTKCPIPAGTYVLRGYEVQNFLKSDLLPKHFLFGHYKVMIEFIRHKKLSGCTYFVFDVVPVWQKKEDRKPKN